jgi:hypothetical protein
LLGLFLLAALLMGGTAWAVTFDLCVGQAVMNMPDGQPVTVWGLGLDPTGTGPCNATVPGPLLRVPWNDPALVVDLRNTLTEPVSLHILGQQLSNNTGPVWDNGASGARPDPGDPVLRVRSFTQEAAGSGGTAHYEWNALRPGTFPLMSATNPAKQVEMGISAVVVKDAALGVAYAENPDIIGDQSVPYDQELILVFQEIDPAIHAAVAAGTYGPGGTITSSVYREPLYFLMNGMGHPDAGLNPVNALLPVSVGNRLLIRFVNLGAETHMPQLLGDYMTVVAEDGNPRNYPVQRYTVELDSGQTIDAVFQPTLPGSLPILDGRLRLTNAGESPGGMLAYLQVDAGEIVTITRARWDGISLNVLATSSTAGGAETLTVTARSSGPDVVKTMAYNAAADRYQKGLSAGNFTYAPTSVTVVSTGGGSDTVPVQNLAGSVIITRARWDGANLNVLATSSVPGGAETLTLTAQGGGPDVVKTMAYNAAQNRYQKGVSAANFTSAPTSVTVDSTDGSSATVPVDNIAP